MWKTSATPLCNVFPPVVGHLPCDGSNDTAADEGFSESFHTLDMLLMNNQLVAHSVMNASEITHYQAWNKCSVASSKGPK
jgi:hypothetical protein